MEVLTISNKEMQINEDIREKEVRVIDVDGAQLGIMTSEAALKIAYDKDLDLVNVAPQAKPPVCRIMDYGKFCFEQAKRERKQKESKVVEIKEIRMFSTIDTNDFNTKLIMPESFRGWR